MTKRAMSLFVGAGLLIGTWSGADAQWLLITSRNHIESLTVSGNTLYAGTSGNETGGWVITSADGGASWRTLDSEGWPKRSRGRLPKVFIVCCVEASGSTLYAGTNDGLYISRDGGASWIPPAGAMAGQTINCVAATPDRIFAGGQKGVLVSEDNGTTWTTTASGLDQSHSIKSLAAAGSAVFAGTYSGILVSRDNGRSWAAANTGLPDKAEIACLAAKGSRVFSGMAGGVFLSDDGGASWVPAGVGLPPGAGASCLAVKGPTIYAGLGELGVFASSDDGKTWQDLNAGLAPGKIRVRFLAAGDGQLTAHFFNSNVNNFEFWRWPLSAGSASPPETARTYFQNGQKAYQENDFQSAVLHYSKAIEIDPGSADAYLQRAWSYAKLGAAGYDKGLSDLAKVLSLDPSNTSVYFARGEIYRGKASLSLKAKNTPEANDLLVKALADYDLALKANPNSSVIPPRIANAYLAMGDLDRARTAYTDLYEKKPTDSEIERALMGVFEEYERQKREIDCGASPLAWNLAGQFYSGKARDDQAIRCFSRALDLGLTEGFIYNLRSQAYARLGDFDRAIADAGKAIELYPSEMYYAERAEIYAKIGEYDKAILDINQAIRLQKKDYNDPSPADKAKYLYSLYWRRGDFYFNKKDWDKAIEDYRLVDGKLLPGLMKMAVNMQLAETYKNKGDAKNAQKYSDLAKTVGPPKK
jgi:tetratricopeptide (TPR) repeat protein